jgi:RNA polymerase sigma-70 factor (ECF subfamily)
MIEQDDSIIVRECLDGNRSRFGDLVKKYTKPIYNLALRMAGNGENAADITQTTFIKAYENLKQFDLSLKFFSWLYRIAINESLNFLQKQKLTDPLDEELASVDGSPEHLVNNNERDEIIQQAIMRLTPEQRSVIVLRHFMDLSYAQMGATLGITETKVKARLFSARLRLRTMLLHKGL